MFLGEVRSTDPERTRRHRCTRGALHDVRELVHEESVPARSVRSVRSTAEDDMRPDGVSLCLDRLRRDSGVGVAVDTHTAEIEPEPLHRAARPGGQGLARCAQRLLHGGWDRSNGVERQTHALADRRRPRAEQRRGWLWSQLAPHVDTGAHLLGLCRMYGVAILSGVCSSTCLYARIVYSNSIRVQNMGTPAIKRTQALRHVPTAECTNRMHSD
jgi:hypothetical protein